MVFIKSDSKPTQKNQKSSRRRRRRGQKTLNPRVSVEFRVLFFCFWNSPEKIIACALLGDKTLVLSAWDF